jgi:hypothetical protein
MGEIFYCRYLDNHLKGTSQSQKRMRFVIGG